MIMKCTELARVRTGLLAVAVTAASLAALGDALPDPVIWWDMEAVSNGKIVDKSGNGRDLTLGSAATLTNGCGGATGTALFFDGSTAASASFPCPALGSRTIAFWFRRSEGSGATTYESGNTYPYLIADLSSLSVNLSNKDTEPYNSYIFARNTQQPAKYFAQSTTPAFWREAWMHFAITLDVTSTEELSADTTVSHVAYKAYLNGACIAAPTTDFVITNLAVAGTAKIGNHANSSRPLHGAIDEFCVWNTALDADQIAAEYERARAEYGDSLIGRWTFDDTETVDGKLVLKNVAGAAGHITCGAGIVVTNVGMEGNAVYCNGTKTSTGSFSLPTAPINNSFSWTCWINQSPDSWKDTSTKIGAANSSPRLLESSNFYCLHLKGAQASEWESQYVNLIVYTTQASGNAHGFSATYGRAPQGSWSHLAVTTRFFVNASNQRCTAVRYYMNGELAYSYEKVIAETSPRETWYFVNNSTTIRPFEGFVDDLRLYAGEVSSNTIARLFRGAAAIDAGEDFSVAGETAELHGEVGVSAPDGIRTGYAGTPRWSLVSAPAGGEGAEILQPRRTATRVTLPVEGEYVFRLSNVLEDVGLARHDDVTVTRIASAGVAPSLSLASASVSGEVDIPVLLSATAAEGARLNWSKVSGPGGVWFEPENVAATEARFSEAGTYVVRCTAEKDGAASVADVTVTIAAASESCDLSDGMICWWPLAGVDMRLDKVGRSLRANMMTNASGVVVASFNDGLAGYAFRPNGYDAYFALGDALRETKSASGDNSPPNERYRAVGAWVWHDPADTNDFKYASLFMVPYTLGLWYNSDCSDGTADGLTLYQQGLQIGGENVGDMQMRYPLPYSMTNRWTHVYALYDRSEGTDFELWIDGVKQTPATSVTTRRGRVRKNAYVGGNPADSSGSQGNGWWKRAGTEDRMSRCFPGKIADLRIYNRKLTAREIKMLAANPDLAANRAPAVDAFASSMGRAPVGEAKTVATAVFDDGEPQGGALTYQWRVLSGDASQVTFGDASARSTTFTASKTGTYILQLAVSDGERTTYSEPLTVEAKSGLVIVVR